MGAQAICCECNGLQCVWPCVPISSGAPVNFAKVVPGGFLLYSQFAATGRGLAESLVEGLETQKQSRAKCKWHGVKVQHVLLRCALAWFVLAYHEASRGAEDQ